MSKTTSPTLPDRRSALGLVDVENLLACLPAEAGEDDFEHAVARFAAASGLGARDRFVVAAAPRGTALFGVVRAWPTAVVRLRSGRDGADHALTDELHCLEKVAGRHHTVVIGSGDHHFAEWAGALGDHGVRVVVVSWERRLSRDLRGAATEVRLLTATPSVHITLAADGKKLVPPEQFALAA